MENSQDGSDNNKEKNVLWSLLEHRYHKFCEATYYQFYGTKSFLRKWCRSANEEIRHLVWNVAYPLLGFEEPAAWEQRLLKAVNITTCHFFTIHFNIILPSAPKSFRSILLFSSSD